MGGWEIEERCQSGSGLSPLAVGARELEGCNPPVEANQVLDILNEYNGRYKLGLVSK